MQAIIVSVIIVAAAGITMVSWWVVQGWFEKRQAWRDRQARLYPLTLRDFELWTVEEEIQLPASLDGCLSEDDLGWLMIDRRLQDLITIGKGDTK